MIELSNLKDLTSLHQMCDDPKLESRIHDNIKLVWHNQYLSREMIKKSRLQLTLILVKNSFQFPEETWDVSYESNDNIQYCL